MWYYLPAESAFIINFVRFEIKLNLFRWDYTRLALVWERKKKTSGLDYSSLRQSPELQYQAWQQTGKKLALFNLRRKISYIDYKEWKIKPFRYLGQLEAKDLNWVVSKITISRSSLQVTWKVLIWAWNLQRHISTPTRWAPNKRTSRDKSLKLSPALRCSRNGNWKSLSLLDSLRLNKRRKRHCLCHCCLHCLTFKITGQ